jgi:hypothetical protein
MDYWNRNPTWNFDRFVADVVVVNVGANDAGKPKKRIKANYHDFLDDLRRTHPNAHIMLYNAWGWDYDEPAHYIHEVIAERGDPEMSFAVFPWIFEQWHGCEYDHAGMAQVLADHLSEEMGWTMGVRDVMSGLGVNGDVANGSFEEVAPFGGYGWRYRTDVGVSREYDPVGAHSGDFYLRLSDGAASHQPSPATPGETVSVSAWMRGSYEGDEVYVTLDFRDQEMWTAPLQTDTEVVILESGWNQYSMSATAPVGTERPVYHSRVTFTAASGAIVDIDDVAMSISGDCVPSNLYVKSIAAETSGIGKGEKRGRAVVTVGDNCGSLVAEATVTGTFSGDYDESASSTTESGGFAILETSAAKKGKIEYIFCVEYISKEGMPYDPGDNVETCDSL